MIIVGGWVIPDDVHAQSEYYYVDKTLWITDVLKFGIAFSGKKVVVQTR